MYDFFAKIYNFFRIQVGLRTDAANNAGSLHAKIKDMVDNYLSPTIGDAYVSDTLRLAADTERSMSGAHDWTKKKEIRVNVDGNIRIAFDTKGTAGSTNIQIFKNGVAAGTERAPSADWVTYTQDFAVNPCDLFQLYLKSTDINSSVYCRNFRIYYDVVVAVAIVVD